MRISLCFRRDGDVFRLLWLNESRDGVYLGMLGAAEDVHFSYHQDGHRHTRIGSEYVHPSDDIPINQWRGIRQLQNASLLVGHPWLSTATAYRGDARTETVFVLDERVFVGTKRCSLDLWLLDRESEKDMLSRMGRGLANQVGFSLIAELIVALDHFPGHKLAITLRAERGPEAVG